ncbi:MAG: phage tail tape measure protein [Rhodopseudomonas palustris]|nr:MAG: phage tail tape measure protein [Rhodopseudomonas palustris]
MGTLTSKLIVELIDKVSGPARTMAGSMKTLIMAGNRAAVLGSSKQLKDNMAAVSRNAATLGATVGAPLALLGAMGAKTAFEFEKAGNMLEALGDATAEQRKEFEKFANTLNSKYPQSLTEILNTGTELLKAGLDFKQMLGALDPTLATAILGEMKPSEVATMISSAINAFQMPKETTEQALKSTTTIADRMSYAAVKTTASLRDMGEMFKYVAGAAGATGSTIDDVTAMAMAFSANKVNGSEAGVALRSAIVRMVKMPAPGMAALERMGLNLRDYQKGAQPISADRIISGLTAGGIDAAPMKKQIEAMVNDPGLKNAPLKLAAKVSALIQESLKNSGSALDAKTIAENVQESIVAAGTKIDLMKFFADIKQKLADGTATMGDISAIFEGRHFARMQAIFAANLDELKRQIEKNAPGYADERYKVANKGIVGQIRELTAAWEGLNIAVGRAVFGEADGAIQGVTKSLRAMSELSPTTLKVVTYIGLATAALIPLGLAISGAAAAIKLIGASIGLVAGAVAALGLPVTLVIGTLAAGAVYVVTHWDEVLQLWQRLKEPWGTLREEMGKTRAAMAQPWSDLPGNMQKTGQNIAGPWDNIREKLASTRDLITGAFEGLGDKIAATWSKISEPMAQAIADIGAKIRASASVLYEAGVELLSQLWAGMKAKFGELLGWVSGIGAKIKGALGMGGGAAPGGGAPAVDGARAAGGPVRAGATYLVGEQGPELWRAPGSGSIVNALDTVREIKRQALAGAAQRSGGGGTSVTNNVSISVQASPGQSPEAVAAAVERRLSDKLNQLSRGAYSDGSYT